MSASSISPLNVSSAVDEITRRIEAAILSGEIPLGSPLNEKQLSDSLGVSRGPLREALRSLEGRKLVERTPNVGPRVVAISKKDIEEIYQLREVLEGAACRIATQTMPLVARKELLDIARTAVARIRAKAKSYSFDGDLGFHQKLLEGTGNQRLVELINGDLFYLLRVFRLRSHTLPVRPLQAWEEHRHIAEAMVAGNAAGAEERMRLHIRNAAREAVRSGKWN
jgi:DNA-binding GntR family transcriptional regulator